MVSEVVEVTLLSLYVSGTATVLGALIGIPLGTYIGLHRFRGRSAVKTLTYTLYGFPPVVAGLLIYLAFSSSGPLGALDLLFTPTAMIIAQTLLVTPMITGITMSSVMDVDEAVKDTARTLGADNRQLARTVIREAKVGVITAVMVGFGRAIAEVGAVIIVGGNIRWNTRVLTTAIVLETRRGNFEFALALGVILLCLATLVYYVLHRFQERGEF